MSKKQNSIWLQYSKHFNSDVSGKHACFGLFGWISRSIRKRISNSQKLSKHTNKTLLVDVAHTKKSSSCCKPTFINQKPSLGLTLTISVKQNPTKCDCAWSMASNSHELTPWSWAHGLDIIMVFLSMSSITFLLIIRRNIVLCHVYIFGTHGLFLFLRVRVVSFCVFKPMLEMLQIEHANVGCRLLSSSPNQYRCSHHIGQASLQRLFVSEFMKNHKTSRPQNEIESAWIIYNWPLFVRVKHLILGGLSPKEEVKKLLIRYDWGCPNNIQAPHQCSARSCLTHYRSPSHACVMGCHGYVPIW